METEKAYLHTPLGIALIEGNESGVCRISILDEKPDDFSAEVPAVLQESVTELEEYFSGIRKDFTMKINPKGTDFQKRVWQELINIPFDTTKSYHKLSVALGDVKAIRAVASANGKNPLWIVVPCHRVIGSDGSLTGYAGGLWRKKWLLEYETPPIQQSLF